MFLTEDQTSLHSTLQALEQENSRLHSEISHSNTLLAALSSLLLIDAREDPFQRVFQTLHSVFEFDLAAAFGGDASGEVICHTATEARLIHSHWICGSFLKRVLAGHPTATIRNRLLPEYSTAPQGLLPPDGTALFVPITMASGHGFVILVKQSAKQGFNRADITLAKKFSILASHAMMAGHARHQIQEREVRVRAAEEANLAQNKFISNMSHELRTPLNAIIGFSDFVNSEMLGPIGVPKYGEYIRDINTSGHYLLAQLDNILLYSKITSGQHRVELSSLDLEAEIKNVCNILEQSALQQKTVISIATRLHGIRVHSDQRSLHQILLNLIDNAIKFSPAGKPVRIDGWQQDGRFTLTITDHGNGICDKVVHNLGMPFLQAEDVLARKHHGTGLGLAICLKLAESISARLEVHHTTEKGTTMDLILPLERSEGLDHCPEKCTEQRA